MSDKPTKFPTKVRTTMQPTVDLEVDEAEWNTLKGQGLLVDTK